MSRAATFILFVVIVQDRVLVLVLFPCLFSSHEAVYPFRDPQRKRPWFQAGSTGGWGNVFRLQDRNSGF